MLGMRVAIVGSRKYPRLDQVVKFVEGLEAGTVVVSGGAAGVDQTARDAAVQRGLVVDVIRPDYMLWGNRKAPLVRNRQIVASADHVIGFWDGFSGGTANAVAWAVTLGKPVKVFMP